MAVQYTLAKMADKLVDATFLVEFLRGYDAPTTTEDQHKADKASTHPLLSNHQLLAETEALLSSLDTPPDTPDQAVIGQTTSNTLCTSSIPKGAAKKKKYTSHDEKRHLRNVQAAKRRLKYRQKLKDEKKRSNSTKVSC